jgi:hypothetical protein
MHAGGCNSEKERALRACPICEAFFDSRGVPKNTKKGVLVHVCGNCNAEGWEIADL